MTVFCVVPSPLGGGDHRDDDAAADQGGDERDGKQCASLMVRMT